MLRRYVEFPDVNFKHKLVAVALLVQKLLKKGERQRIQKRIFVARFLEASLNTLHVICDISGLELAIDLCLVSN